MSGWDSSSLENRNRLRLRLGPRGPHEARTSQDERAADHSEQGGECEAELQGRGRRGSDAELSDQGVRHAGPGLGANRGVDQVLTVELCPVAAIDRDLVGGSAVYTVPSGA